MPPAVFAHVAPGIGTLGFSPGLVLYLSLAVLLLLTFALRVGWPVAHHAAASPAGAPGWPGRGLNPIIGAVLRGFGLAGLAVLLACGWLGSDQIGANPISIAVVWVFWIGGQLLTALVGDWWRLVHPFDTIAGWVEREPPGWPEVAALGVTAGGGRDREPTEPSDWWVPAALLLSFSWLWLCWPEGIRPRSVAGWLTAYTATMLAGAIAGGRTWVRRNEAFGVVFGLIAAVSVVDWTPAGAEGQSSTGIDAHSTTGPVAPVGSTGHGATLEAAPPRAAERTARPVRLRSPLEGLDRVVVGRREMAVMTVMLGTVVFDALGSKAWWTNLVGERSQLGYTLFDTFGLLWVSAMAYLAWLTAARFAARAAAPDAESGSAAPDTADATERYRSASYLLAAPLALLAVGLAVAHESSALLVNAQNFVALMSDPFARSWNLLGTGSIVVNPTFPSVTGQAWISLLLIVATLIATLIAFHERALAGFGSRRGASASWSIFGFMAAASAVSMGLLL